MPKTIAKSLSIFLVVLSLLFLSGCSEEEATYTIVMGETDGSHAPVQLDETTQGLVTLGTVDHAIHEGFAFYSYDVTDLGNAENRTILLDTTNTTGRYTYFYWVVDMELEATVDIYEDAIISDNGTTMPVYNRNRNSSIVNTTLIRHSPTVTDFGLLIFEQHLGSGKKAGGTENALNELVLKQGTRYLLIITNQTANNNVVSGKMIWYELD